MKRRLFVLLALAACKTSPIVTLVEQPTQCKAPRFDTSATCEEIEKTFYADMANACSGAQPALSEALRAVARNELVRPPPEGSSGWRTIDRRSFTLYQASWKLLPAECTTDFNAGNFPGDDYGRGVGEVSELWRAHARCRPDEALFVARGDAQGRIDIGVWSFATVLAPHLDEAGKAYLRKLLVCEER
jgi:hypothetical protein